MPLSYGSEGRLAIRHATDDSRRAYRWRPSSKLGNQSATVLSPGRDFAFTRTAVKVKPERIIAIYGPVTWQSCRHQQRE